jgi:pyruvate/2-oxoglutarate dehydrogenase complex dihydrolipoamide acyltransferase (E2) component
MNAPVKADDPVAEIETEKATYELQAGFDGTLYQVAKIGAVLPVEALIGYIIKEGEQPPVDPAGQVASRSQKNEEDPRPRESGSVPAYEGIRASPIAKRLAGEHGLDLTLITGSGPNGRIVEADVRAVLAASVAPNQAGTAPLLRRAGRRIPLTRMRATIAERLHHSLMTAASITITREVVAEKLVEMRRRLAATLGVKLPYDALFVKLFATALREYPTFNSILQKDTIVVLDDVHVGFAVALPEGLVVPVVRNADSRTLADIATTMSELTARAQVGSLRPADVTDGTASISNLGSYGVDAFTPILNPPQSALLGIGRVAERATVENGRIAIAPTCVLSLTFDHRVADGAPAARLLDSIARQMADDSYLGALG